MSSLDSGKCDSIKEPLNKDEPISQEFDAIGINEEESSFNQNFLKPITSLL